MAAKKKALDLATCTPDEREVYWTKVAQKQLLGKTITAVRYLSRKEADNMGWGARCVVFKLNDGNIIIASQDDEGNGPGALFTQDKEHSTLPVL